MNAPTEPFIDRRFNDAEKGLIIGTNQELRFSLISNLIQTYTTADRSQEIPNESDTTKFFGFTAVRTSSQFREDNPDIVYLVYDWNRARADFLTDELGLSLEIADEMNASYENAFRHYRQKTGALVSQAQEIFGIDVGIILENELKIEFDNSYENYESSLRTLLGDANYFKFDNFRESYRRFTAECLGWLPGSVIK